MKLTPVEDIILAILVLYLFWLVILSVILLHHEARLKKE